MEDAYLKADEELINKLVEQQVLLKQERDVALEALELVKEQRKNIAQNLGRAEERYMKLRIQFSKIVHERSELRGQLVRLVAWCEKKFGLSIVDLIKKDNWPDHIADVVMKVIDETGPCSQCTNWLRGECVTPIPCDMRYSAFKEKHAKIQVGWYNPKTNAFCRLDVKPGLSRGADYNKPVFMLGE